MPCLRFMRRSLLYVALFICLPAAAFAQKGAVSAADPRAAAAGQEMLRQGGTAADAALAMMLALTVVEPASSGIGGGGFFMYHDSKADDVATIDGRETAPAALREDRFLGLDGKVKDFPEGIIGGYSVGVPGNIALMAKAHARWGNLPWEKLFQPAITLAEKGYVATPRLAGTIARMAPRWDGLDATKAVYFQDGRPKVAGEVIRNPALAKTLRRIARKGPRAFYTGQIAKKIASAVSNAPLNAAPMTVADLATYEAKERPPVCVLYRVYRLCGMGPPSSGATTVFQILGMVERFDLKALGPENPQAWHLIAEAMQLAYADREKYLADPDYVAVPVPGLLDEAYIASRSALVSENKARSSYAAGTPPGAEPRTAALSGEVTGTTHFVAADRFGNVANMTSTVQGPFGSQLVAAGMILNNELSDFSFAPIKDGAPVANRPQPGKRPLSSMSPTIVYSSDGKPIFAVGAAGGKRIIMQVAKTLIAHLDWGMNAQAALAAPNIYFDGDALLLERGTPLEAQAEALVQFGHVVRVTAITPSKANAVEQTTAGWVGAADPRSDGAWLND
jgi:gamma-glutamyltranspeptidase/glutathione hydrolase